MGYVAYKDMEEAVARRKPFEGNSAKGELDPHLPIDPGLLDAAEAARLMDDCEHITYLVTSYNTPIGWAVDQDGWPDIYYVVEQTFSVTTSRLQNLLRREWNL